MMFTSTSYLKALGGWQDDKSGSKRPNWELPQLYSSSLSLHASISCFKDILVVHFVLQVVLCGIMQTRRSWASTPASLRSLRATRPQCSVPALPSQCWRMTRLHASDVQILARAYSLSAEKLDTRGEVRSTATTLGCSALVLLSFLRSDKSLRLHDREGKVRIPVSGIVPAAPCCSKEPADYVLHGLDRRHSLPGLQLRPLKFFILRFASPVQAPFHAVTLTP